jgi:dihydrofolate reductase
LANLVYSVIASLDGYIEDASGRFDWAQPDEEVHSFVNDLTRPVGTHLLGRRMYETMVYWEDLQDLADQPRYAQDFATIWQSADKIVYSRTLQTVETARTQLEHDFDPEAVGRLKAAATRDISVGGAELASRAIEAGLVDVYQLLLVPVLVGGGKRALPDDNVRANLQLVEERRFGNGTVFLGYRVRA